MSTFVVIMTVLWLAFFIFYIHGSNKETSGIRTGLLDLDTELRIRELESTLCDFGKRIEKLEKGMGDMDRSPA